MNSFGSTVEPTWSASLFSIAESPSGHALARQSRPASEKNEFTSASTRTYEKNPIAIAMPPWWIYAKTEYQTWPFSGRASPPSVMRTTLGGRALLQDLDGGFWLGGYLESDVARCFTMKRAPVFVVDLVVEQRDCQDAWLSRHPGCVHYAWNDKLKCDSG